MQAVHEILNALMKAFDRRTVLATVEGWVAAKRAEEFLAANPGFGFSNEGVRHPPVLVSTAAPPTAPLDAAAALGAALKPTANGSGRYGYFSGVPDEDVVAEALLGLSEGAANKEVEALTASAAALTVTETAADREN